VYLYGIRPKCVQAHTDPPQMIEWDADQIVRMTLVTLLSTFGMALGLGGIVPQLIRMASSRSAAGQAAAGWGMGLAANLSMAYVNAVGFHAALLTASNLLAAGLCATALTLVTLLRGEPAAAAPEYALDDLATQEFVVLRDAVLRADAARATA
jgi:hypothetical protein